MSASAAAKAPGSAPAKYPDCRNLINAERCRCLPPGFVAPKITVATRAHAPLGTRMIDRCTLRFAEQSCIGALASIALLHSAFAATHEQIIERCRESARPQVRACMMGKRGSGDRESNLAACRESVGKPIVRACVLREEQKQAAKTPPPAAPKDEAAIAPKDAPSVQPVFVAPP